MNNTAIATSNLGLHVTQYPSGRFGFVGRVPEALMYVQADGSALTDSQWATVRQSGAGLLGKKIRRVSFATKAEAVAAAEALGCEVAA